ncbi:MAG: hypothetical protein WCD50_01755 [Onishia taeanensis]|uniref:hypothetical protein n=1 Tax=Onishia taeanensis TaxID=284577 RepID=UPI003C7BFB3C
MSSDIALLHAINGQSSQFPALNPLMIAITHFGVLLMVLPWCRCVGPARSVIGSATSQPRQAWRIAVGWLNQLVLLFVQRVRYVPHPTVQQRAWQDWP